MLAKNNSNPPLSPVKPQVCTWRFNFLNNITLKDSVKFCRQPERLREAVELNRYFYTCFASFGETA